MERWAVRLALWLDRHGVISEASRNFGAVLRLFGLERFRDGQLPVVEAALSGQSVLVISPTGFGKTLCFQLPAVLRQGVVFIDETWTRTNMTPLRGWAPCGLRLQAKAPHGHWKTTTFLAALRHEQ